MRGYERDEYEDWDEYEDEEGEEQEEEEGGEDEYEEPAQPTQEELEYLELRQRLKDSIRKQMKKELGSASAGSRDKVNSLRKDNYGSFFGPSQPVIAQRVIQESKSLLENPDLAARINKRNHTTNKSSSSAPVSSKPRPNQTKSAPNRFKKKAEILKTTRDYSFLLSEDAEIPASTKPPPARNLSAPKSDARSAPQPPRSKQVANDRGREISNGRDGRKPIYAGGSENRPRAGVERTAQLNKPSIESRKQLGSNNGSGPGRPVGPGRPLGPKSLPSKSSGPSTGKVNPPISRNTTAGAHRPTSSSTQSGARRPMPSNLQSGNHRPDPVHGQSQSQRPVVRKPSVPQEASRPKVVSKQPLPSSRDQLRRPPAKPSTDGALGRARPKPKPKRRHPDEGSGDEEQAISMIREMFGYNPDKYQNDDDDSDMEANFDDILREEKHSAKIARKEDEEQARLIEEEERRERMRLAKKRKMGR